MKCTFLPGDRLVCIDDSSPKTRRYRNMVIGIVRGEIYTCKDVKPYPTGVVCIRLEEIRGWLHHDRFEKLKDLSIFHEMCKKAPAPKKELVESKP